MNIGLFTDAKYHNLALMKISAFHKQKGDIISLNCIGNYDITYGSWLFDFTRKVKCDIEGGPYYVLMWMRSGQCSNVCGDREMEVEVTLPTNMVGVVPDYNLFPINYSLGYTWDWCPNKCGFCIVPNLKHEKKHHSIWEFHNPKFNTVCLLNNNTFSDPQWKETFEEIWDANLFLRDENGYDLRLLDEEKAEALKKTKFEGGYFGFAWDLMKNSDRILRGLEIAKKWKLLSHNTHVYILVGYDTTEEEDIYRVQKVVDFGADPFIMVYDRNNRRLREFKRMCSLYYYRSFNSIEAAWNTYRYKHKFQQLKVAI
jgi:hypothetical protein